MKKFQLRKRGKVKITKKLITHLFIIADALFTADAGPLTLFMMKPNISAIQDTNSNLNFVFPCLELPPVIQFNSFHIKTCLGSSSVSGEQGAGPHTLLRQPGEHRQCAAQHAKLPLSLRI